MAEQLETMVTNESPGSHLDGVGDSRDTLWEAGFRSPGWRDFVSNHPSAPRPEQHGRRRTRIPLGWQVVSSMSLEERFVSASCGHPLRSSPRPVPFPVTPRDECALHQFPSLPTTADSTLSRSACFFCAAFISLHHRAACQWQGSGTVGFRSGKRGRFVARQGPKCR